MLHHNIRARATPITTQIVAIDVLAPDVRRLVLQLPPNHPFRYRAGQFVSLVLPDGSRRSLSPACAPRVDDCIVFHVQRQPNGVLSNLVFRDFVLGDSVAIEGPFGNCVLGHRSNPTVMLATGTGIAPLMAMLEENFACGTPRPITLFWGGRTLRDLYAAPTLESWARQRLNFRFIPVLSSTGIYVQDAAAAIFPDFFGIDIYACGSPGMVESARAKLLTFPGASPDRFYADAFLPSGAAAAPSSPSIVIHHADANIEVPIGASLLAALTNAGVAINSVCGGQASCGTCRVKLAPEWHDHFPPPNKTERRLLAYLESPVLIHRLACQITLEPHHAGLVFSLDP